MASFKEMIQKLQLGINKTEKYHVMYNVNQFYSPEQRRPINMYSIKFAKYNEEKGKNEYEEVFKDAHQLYIVFFLRNLLFSLQGKEIPTTDYPDFDMKWNTFADEYLG